ncbi:MAG: flagellar FliL protein [Candidatus Azotimanducaceae bacterium]|jgi:flagellar FliL protein
MINKMLPLMLLLVGAGTGVGAGFFLRPMPDEMLAEMAMPAEKGTKDDRAAIFEYVKMNNQFVVPIVKDRKVRSLVVVTLTIEVPVGQKDAVYAKEPKLRDSFLQVLFDHANMGGFEGEFTDSSNLDVLRNALREIGQRDMGEGITDVLIMEVARQDY